MTSVRREAMDLTDTRLLLNRLSASVRSDGASPRSFALLLRKAVEERAWEVEGFRSFHSYMTTPETSGGLDMAEDKLMDAARLADIESLVRQLLLEEIPAAMMHGDGPGRGHTEKRLRGTKSFLPESDTSDRVVARLRRDDPELAERVVRGEVTANAAAQEKGWRKPRIVLTSPESVARALRRHMSADALARLVLLLVADPPHEKPED
jgi:hypothetical protein